MHVNDVGTADDSCHIYIYICPFLNFHYFIWHSLQLCIIIIAILLKNLRFRDVTEIVPGCRARWWQTWDLNSCLYVFPSMRHCFKKMKGRGIIMGRETELWMIVVYVLDMEEFGKVLESSSKAGWAGGTRHKSSW